METNDNELLSLYVRHNSEAAFETLIRRHSAMVLAVCRGYLWRKEDVEDAFQAVFILLSKKASKLLRHKSVGGWLHEATTRICLQLRRQIARSREVTMIDIPSNDNEPWQTIAETRDLESLHREISRLPKRYREVLILYHFEGMSRSQIATLLDCSTASVKAALARARDKLRHRLLQRGIAGSAVLGCASSMTKHARADSAIETDSLIQSTLDYCSGRPSSFDMGNGPGCLESLLAKETIMTNFGLGSVQTLYGIIVAASMLCVATVAAIAGSPGEDGTGVVVTVSEQSSTAGNAQEASVKTTLVAQNNGQGSIRVQDRGKAVVISSTPTRNLVPVQVQTTNFPSTKLSLLQLKTDGKTITYAAPVYTTEEVPQNYVRHVPVVENGIASTRAEKGTHKVSIRRSTGEIEDRPISSKTTFETLDGKPLSTEEMINRIGNDKLAVVALGPTQENLPEEWKAVLRPGTIIAHQGVNVHRVETPTLFRESTQPPPVSTRRSSSDK